MDNNTPNSKSTQNPQATVPVSVRREAAQHTRPTPPIRPAPSAPVSHQPQGNVPQRPFQPPPPAQRSAPPSNRPNRPRKTPLWRRTLGAGRVRIPIWAAGISAVFGVILLTLALFLSLGMAALGSDHILPGVSVAGIRVGGLTQDEAARVLDSHWAAFRLTDSGSGTSWQIPTPALGLNLDTATSAAQAYRVGREDGRFFAGLMSVDIKPAGIFDGDAARVGLSEFVDDVSTPAQNAGIALENGIVKATPAREGRTMDLDGTLTLLASDPLGWLRDGKLPLKMITLSPAVTDSSQLVSAGQTLLTQPLMLNLYDPFTGNTTQVSTPPEVWGAWLTAEPDSTDALGVRLTLEDSALRAFINEADAQAGEYRYLNADEIVATFQAAVRGLRSDAWARVYHEDRPRIVQAGETIISIAYQEGVPYPWIQKWNGNISNVNVGQTLIIPSADNFFEYEPVPNKRVMISISQQRAWVYEDGTLKWEWVISTGIADSPTWPGVYQIISHYPNAYAGNWNLYMPWFLGVYQPIPGADFTNGFHGYPTRGGGQILWRDNLGTRVTFGCILLDDANARQLYEWAEEGVIVEIRA